MRLFRRLSVLMFLFLLAYSSSLLAQDYWGRIKSPAMNLPTQIDFDSRDRLYMSTWGNGISFSEDDGATWYEKNTGLNNLYINAFFIADNDDLYAVTEGGGVYYSSYGTLNWLDITSNMDNLNARDVFALNKDTIFVATHGSGVYFTADGGTTWEKRNTGLENLDIRHIIFTPTEKHLIAHAWGKCFYLSKDYGKTWKPSGIGAGFEFVTDLKLDKYGYPYATSLNKGLIESSDDGISWTLYETTDGLTDINAQCFTFDKDNVPVIACRSIGIRFFDIVNTETWMKTKNNGPNGATYSMTTKSTGEIFAASYNGKMYHAMPNDHLWKTKDLDKDGINAFTSLSLDKHYLYAALDSGDIYMSSDMGNTWDASGFNSLTLDFTKSSNSVFAATSEGLAINDNGSASWRTKVLPDSFLPMDLVYVTEQKVVIAAMKVVGDKDPVIHANVYIYDDSDGSFTAANYTAPSADQYPSKIYKNKNSEKLYLINSDNSMQISADTGKTWFAASELSGISAGDLYAEGKRLIISSFDKIKVSNNNGQSFTDYDFGLSNPQFLDIVKNTQDEFIISSRNYPFIWKTKDFVEWDSIPADIFKVYNRPTLHASSSGYTFFSNNELTLNLDPSKLGIPEITFPEKYAKGLDLDISVTWSKAAEADLYEVQIARDEEFMLLVDQCLQKDTFRILGTNLKKNMTYYCRVRSRMFASAGEWSEVIPFTTKLESPILETPENNKKGMLQTAMLTWFTVDSADTYQVQISKDETFTDLVEDQIDIADTLFNFADLEAHTMYYWRVMAFNENADSDWSEIWNFQTVVAAPVLKSPDNTSWGHDTTVTMEWYLSDEAEDYEIQVAKDAEFTIPVFQDQSETPTSHMLSLLEYNTEYFWRVRCGNQYGWSLWSEAWSFKTNYQPVALISPSDSAKHQPTSIQLQWNTYDEANSYNLQLATDAEFNNIVHEESELDDFQFTVDDLTHFNDYFWRVSLNGEEGQGFWSDIWTFQTDLETPSLYFPANNAEDQKTFLKLIWVGVEGAEFYRVQVATDNEFNNIAAYKDSLIVINHDFNFEGKTKYYWRVQAFNEWGSSPWSDYYEFTTKDGNSISDNIAEIEDLNIYPNPSSDKLNIRINTNELTKMKITLVNNKGEQIAMIYNDFISNEDIISYDVRTLASAVYYIKLETNSGYDLVPISIRK